MADVVIAGYGPAGAAAAIAAHDAGRSVLVLESVERGGGNARYSGGFLFDVPDDAAVAHLDALCFRPHGPRVLEAGCDGSHAPHMISAVLNPRNFGSRNFGTL